MPTQCPGSQFAVRGRTGQFAPGGGKLRLRLSEPLAHVRGGGCKGAAGTLPFPLTNATERDTIEIEKESLPVRRLAQFMYYLRSSRNPWTGAATFSCF